MSHVLMKCGCVSNAINAKTNEPVCIIHMGLTKDAEIIDSNPPTLVNRMARCNYFGKIPSGSNHSSNYGCKRGEHCMCQQPSSLDLPFFSINNTKEFDEFYCGCWGWE